MKPQQERTQVLTLRRLLACLCASRLRRSVLGAFRPLSCSLHCQLCVLRLRQCIWHRKRKAIPRCGVRGTVTLERMTGHWGTPIVSPESDSIVTQVGAQCRMCFVRV